MIFIYNRYMRYIFFFLFSALFFVFPEGGAQAQILTCTSAETCNFCELVNTVDRAAGWLVIVAILIATIGLMWSGAKMVYSRGDVSSYTAAKEMLTNIVIGIFIVALAALVVDAILKALVGGQIGLWDPPADCADMRAITDPNSDLMITESYTAVLRDVSMSESESTIVQSYYSPTGTSNISSFSGTLETYAGHQFDSNIISQVNYIATTYNLRVSGGHRTVERNAEVGGVPNSLHLSGRAADFVGTRANMEAALSWARANGAREALIHDAGSGTHLHVGW